ncbi:unnamed protein product [Moneuplotes crassus]|uniref:ABC3 transporter permease C-terminal domain-containing protein n=1 Tax=Euplotes crassus TaxID=5936 RepID=A0AAD1XPE2_EUPCR|nr:unnamed protein product [Moneuplotes crassus]
MLKFTKEGSQTSRELFLHQKRASGSLVLKEVIPWTNSSSYIQCLMQQVHFHLENNIHNMYRHKCQFLISTLSIFIVVLVCLIANSVIDKAPVIFLRLAEQNSGEIDAFLLPASPTRVVDSSSGKKKLFTTLNYTAVQEELPRVNLTPRNYMKAFMHKADDHPAEQSKTPLDCKLCHREQKFLNDISLVFMDTDREREIKIGVNYHFPKLFKNECIISRSLLKESKLKLGSMAKVTFDGEHILNILATKLSKISHFPLPSIHDIGSIEVECLLKSEIAESFGKMDDQSVEKVLILEYEYMFDYVIDHVRKSLNRKEQSAMHQAASRLLIQSADQQNPYHYASTILMTFPEPRLDYYKNSDYNELLQSSLAEMNSLTQKLGYYPISVELPLLKQMEQFSVAILFMGLLFSMILAVFLAISIILIYGLLLVNVQQKSFEHGIKRMLGSSKWGLVKDVAVQTLCFVVPGIIFAFLCSFLILRVIYYYFFEQQLGLKMDPNPTYFAVCNAIMLGLVIPFVSSLIPIKNALSQNLNDALDFERSQTKAEVIEVINPSSKNIRIVLIIGAISAIYGFIIFVLLPQSLMSLNFGIILAVFFLILGGFLVGVVLVAMNFQHIIEVAITLSLFWLERTCIRTLILKNLIAHRIRNASTTLVYALSLSFLILCVVSYSLQVQNITLVKTKDWGEIRLGGKDHFLLYERVEEYIKKNPEKIANFGYKGHVLENYYYSDSFASPHSRYSSQPVQISSVSPSLFETLNQDQIKINYASESALTFGEQLYTKDGSHGSGLGSYLSEKLHLFPQKFESSFLVTIPDSDSGRETSSFFTLKPTFILDSAPGLGIGSRKHSDKPEMVVSFTTKEFLYTKLSRPRRMIPVKYAYLTLTDSKYAAEVITYMKQFTEVNSVYDAEEVLKEVKAILDTIFSVLICLSMFLCLFSLVSSTSANMMEQSKEVGVLRAIGFTKFMVKRLYFYETFVLVFASSCLGIIVGTFVGWTMTVQQANFLSIPIAFYFPYKHLLWACLASLICALVAIWAPASKILSKEISEIFKINS